MIELYGRLATDGSIEEMFESGKKALRANRIEQAAHALVSGLSATHAREELYTATAQLACDVFERMNDPRAALSVAWYTGDADRQGKLLKQVPAIDRARTYGAWAALDPGRGRELHARAAKELEQAGHLVRAAIHFEKAADAQSARTLWSRLSQAIDGRRDPYAAGLSRFNLARTCQGCGDERGAHDATVGAVHRLEEAADRFESTGQRERAFDCYHVLISIGEHSGAFEHVLEGAVNAIRILAEDNLRYHALRLQAHAIQLAESSGELPAAATLAREMTDFARKQGLLRVAAGGTLRQAELWRRVAERTLERKGPQQLAENALLASLLASAEAGRYVQVGALYERLQEVAGDPARQAHYARAARRYKGARDEVRPGEEADERLGEHVGPPAVWHVDLLEWEERGSAAEAAANVLLDPEEAGDRITRRTTLIGRLVALAAEAAPPDQATVAAVTLAQALGPIGLYALLAPLEVLYERSEPQVRLAAVQSLSRYFYKRTFVTLERALRDPDEAVVTEAASALERLRFDHAFEPLARIYRTTTRVDARLAALRAIARIDVLDAAELMLGVLEHGGPDERSAAMDALKVARGGRFFEIGRAAYPQAPERLKSALADVFRARGVAL